MTNEEKEAIKFVKKRILYWNNYMGREDKSYDDVLIDLIEKQDNIIKSMAKELTNLIDEDVDTIIKKFEEEN